MIEQLVEMPTYEAYKDSGVEWLGDIPEHWQVKALKHIAFMKSGETISPDQFTEDGFPVFGGNGFRGYTKTFTNEGCFVLIGRQGALCGNVNYAEGQFFASEHAIVVYPLNKENYFWLGESIRLADLNRFSQSAAQPGIAVNVIKNVLFPYPPLPEQTAIAAFLDRKTTQIDQAVAIKEQQIALLKERKQILIQNAVTRGLDPNVPMRNSGVKWIGEIPAHWNCSRLKLHSKIQSGITLGKSYSHKSLVEMPYIRVANVQSGYFKLDDIATILVPNNEISRYLLSDGDILVTEGGDIDKLGRGTVWRNSIKPCLHQNHVFAVRVNKFFLFQDFVSNFLATDMARKYFIDTATKTTNLASTNRTHLGNLYLPMPTLSEQQAIVTHIETQSAKIDQAIAIQQQQIDKLKEYKATLINSAVTGKIRVPEVAA